MDKRNPPDKPRGPNQWVVLFIMIIAAIVVMNLFNSWMVQDVEKISVDQLYHAIEKKEVTSLTVSKTDTLYTVRGKFTNGKIFELQVIDGQDLQRVSLQNGIPLTVYTPFNFGTLFNFLFFGGLIFFLFMMMRGVTRQGSGLLGGSVARMEKTKDTFENVGGLKEIREEINDVIDYYKNSAEYQAFGLDPIRGILLFGSPGVGKTLIARAMANAVGIPFIHAKGSDFVEIFVGNGARKVRELFDFAKKHAPCCLFIDEIDSLAPARTYKFGHSENEQTLNAMLAEMDGFQGDTGVMVIGATNRPEILDPAILRPGRFDRKLVLPLPDKDSRVEILKIHSRKFKLSQNIDLAQIAQMTPGYSGADLKNLMNESGWTAARRFKGLIGLMWFKKAYIEFQDVSEAYDKVNWGKASGRKLTEKDKQCTAVHEAGHTLVSFLEPEADKPRKVTIIPRGVFLGATFMLPEDRVGYNKQFVLATVRTCLGGRAAEEIVLQEISSGASGDFKSVKSLVQRYVAAWGMDEKFGMVPYIEQGQFLAGSEIVASEARKFQIEERVCEIVNDLYQQTKTIIEENRDKLDQLAKALLQKETLEKDEIEEILKDNN